MERVQIGAFTVKMDGIWEDSKSKVKITLQDSKVKLS
jgi:hypothetical protein